MATQAERRSTTIRAILDAARNLFVSRGFENTSVDEIAALAQVAKGAVYHHFASKELIFAQVFEEMTAQLRDAGAAGCRAGKDVLDSIRRGTLKYLTSIAGDKFRQVLLIDGPKVLGWEHWRAVDARYFGGNDEHSAWCDAEAARLSSRDRSAGPSDRRRDQRGSPGLRSLRQSRPSRERPERRFAEDAGAVLQSAVLR